jgi:hypothetical protein
MRRSSRVRRLFPSGQRCRFVSALLGQEVTVDVRNGGDFHE